MVVPFSFCFKPPREWGHQLNKDEKNLYVDGCQVYYQEITVSNFDSIKRLKEDRKRFDLEASNSLEHARTLCPKEPHPVLPGAGHYSRQPFGSFARRFCQGWFPFPLITHYSGNWKHWDTFLFFESPCGKLRDSLPNQQRQAHCFFSQGCGRIDPLAHFPVLRTTQTSRRTRMMTRRRCTT